MQCTKKKRCESVLGALELWLHLTQYQVTNIIFLLLCYWQRTVANYCNILLLRVMKCCYANVSKTVMLAVLQLFVLVIKNHALLLILTDRDCDYVQRHSKQTHYCRDQHFTDALYSLGPSNPKICKIFIASHTFLAKHAAEVCFSAEKLSSEVCTETGTIRTNPPVKNWITCWWYCGSHI